LLGPALQTANACSRDDKQTSTIEQVKIQVAKLGIGDKARGTITTKAGAKVKGYVYSAGDDDFVMRHRKTDAPTTIRYADVVKVERNKGPFNGPEYFDRSGYRRWRLAYRASDRNCAV
jgi:hypothetical protein